MKTTKLRLILAISLTIAISQSFAKSVKELNPISISIEVNQENDDFKYGQYVYVTLKDGSLTVGKIVGKKSPKKYYVNQLNGSNHGLVHKKYIRKMTKEEIGNYKSSKKSITKHG